MAKYSRSPHGERGLKFFQPLHFAPAHGRSPHGERGLKYLLRHHKGLALAGRSPHGERGLK